MDKFSYVYLIALLCAASARVATALVGSSLRSSEKACNFGPTHHSHLVLPLTDTAETCKQPGAPFFLSHGATFFCPHTFDVKLLGTIAEDDARAALCDSHFAARAAGVSSKVLLRPTLPAGGLPALARGEMPSWTSPVAYHIHNFGKDNDAGPDDGWNVTVIHNATSTVRVTRVLYGREFDVQPKPGALTYLAHSAQGAPGFNAVLSHYISTSGTSGFDQLAAATVSLTAADGGGPPVALRDTWPTYLTVPGRDDAYAQRLRQGGGGGGGAVDGLLHGYDAHGMPSTVAVSVRVMLDYYAGTSDGFAGFGTMCPFPPPHPQSPTVCGLGTDE